MAKKTNLKAEKAKRNKAYALKYKKRRPSFSRRGAGPRRFESTPATAGGSESSES